MMTITPTTPEDVLEFRQAMPPCRIRAMTGRVDGKIVGIGGIAYFPDGTIAAFLEATDEARKYAVTLHKAALKALKGHRRIIAKCDPTIEAAPRWLKRLGFEPAGAEVYVKHVRA